MCDEEKIVITQKEYDDLIEDQQWLNCLQNAGVDNWDGFDFAKELLEDYNT